MASLADALEYQHKQKRTLSDLLDDISYGAGEGISENLQGLGQMVMHPIDTARQVYGGVKAAVQNPQAAYQAAKQGVTEAMSSPQAAARFIGQNFSPVELANGLSNVGKMREITVYHGTPHKLPPTKNNPLGEFDASKIGTGEGAASYGHGIYVAANPKVAESYRNSLSNTKFLTKSGQDLKETLYGGSFASLMNQMARDGKTNEQIIEHLKYEAKDAADRASIWPKGAKTKSNLEKQSKNAEKLASKVESGDVAFRGGSLYTVDLPDSHIDRMLDWDKPLSEQHPDVQAALENSKNKQIRAMLEYAKTPYSSAGIENEAKTMGEAYRVLSMNLSGRANADSAKASQLLQKSGIPGIKYLDAGSRGTGNGTRNFVVFPGEEHNLKILDRK